MGFAPEEFSGHSLRAGFATSAAAAGANERDIMEHTRHKSDQMVRRYIRKGVILALLVGCALRRLELASLIYRGPDEGRAVGDRRPFRERWPHPDDGDLGVGQAGDPTPG